MLGLLRKITGLVLAASIKVRAIVALCIMAIAITALSWIVENQKIRQSFALSMEFAATEVSSAINSHIEAATVPLSNEMQFISSSADLLTVMQTGNETAINDALSPALERLRDHGIVSYLALYDAAGRLVALHGIETANPNPMSQLVTLTVTTSRPQSGFDRMDDNTAVFAHAVPLMRNNALVGFAVLAIDLGDAFADIAMDSEHLAAFRMAPNENDVFETPWRLSWGSQVSKDEASVVAGAPSAQQIQDALSNGAFGADIEKDGRIWRTLRVSFFDLAGRPFAEGALMSDKTEAIQAALSRTSKASAALFAMIALMMLVCVYWLERAFKPLDRAIRTMISIVENKPYLDLLDDSAQTHQAEEVRRIYAVVKKVARVFDDRRKLQAAAEHDATHDAMTGLPNRAHFNTHLMNAIDRSQQDLNASGYLIMIDLDYFKALNDSKGHHIGDVLLRETSTRLQSFVGSQGFAARLGGDEFAAVLPRHAWDAPIEVTLQSLHAHLSGHLVLDQEPYSPSFSLGVAQFPLDGTSLDSVLINADVALYEAKRNGRSQWYVFDHAMRAKFSEREFIRRALESTLETDGVSVVFQPVFTMHDQKHCGFEALARLAFEGRNIPPDQFVPVAEEIGMMGRLGQDIMQKALAAQRQMLDCGLLPGTLSINISSKQLADQSFVDLLDECLIYNDIAPDTLCVEIKENALIGRSAEAVLPTLHKMRGSGISIALDDFGTGFSSLSHLRDFSISRMKIDENFVQDIEVSTDNAALAAGLIELARALGLETIAEGVETRTQFEFLRDMGCNYSQGFLHTQPLSVNEAIHYLKTCPAQKIA